MFTRRRVAVFIDGCFWHTCPVHGRNPAVNTSYWGPKLLRTVERDNATNEALLNAGWYVVRIWEHVPCEDAVSRFEHVFDVTLPAVRDVNSQTGELTVIG